MLYLKITLDEYAFVSAMLMKRLMNDAFGMEFHEWKYRHLHVTGEVMNTLVSYSTHLIL